MSGLFQVGDLVFAKVRGYRPWPARVEGTFLETPKLRKYSVFFFGTSQRGICSENNVFPYAQNKAKYGRPVKIRGFQQALAEIKEAASFVDNLKDPADIKQEEQEQQASCIIKTELEDDLGKQMNFSVHEENIDSEEPWLQQLKEEMEDPQFNNNTWRDVDEESPEVELKDSEVDIENSSEADNFIVTSCETENTKNDYNSGEFLTSKNEQGIRKEIDEELKETEVVNKRSHLTGKYRKAKLTALAKIIDKERSSSEKSFSMVSQKCVRNKKSFVCEICGKFCRDNFALRNHKIVHSGERPFKCPLCEKTFKRKQSIVNHKQCYKGDQETKKYRCETCGKLFSDNFALRQHKTVYCIGRSFKCPLREKTFKQKQISGKHEQSPLGKQETKKFKCEICGKCFDNKLNLCRHRIVHSGEKPFKCTMCEKTFKWKASAAIHMQFHVGEALHKCSVCEKAFHLRWQLKVHERIHTGEKPFECGDCGKTFAQRGTLIYHIRTHTGEKPYKCSQCDKEYVKRGDLNRHMLIHAGKQPFACKYCGRCFRRAYYISEHVSRVHGILYSSSE